MALIRRLRSSPRHPLDTKCTVVITSQCLESVAEGMSAEVKNGHEGIVYFLGLTTGTTALAVAALFPEAVTTSGSVDVSSAEMRKIVRAAADAGLQVVGQLHTHPVTAFHSAGDLAGMRIRYPGYVSVVVPHYGAFLPSLQDAHTVMCTGNSFRDLDEPIRVVGEVS